MILLKSLALKKVEHRLSAYRLIVENPFLFESKNHGRLFWQLDQSIPRARETHMVFVKSLLALFFTSLHH